MSNFFDKVFENEFDKQCKNVWSRLTKTDKIIFNKMFTINIKAFIEPKHIERNERKEEIKMHEKIVVAFKLTSNMSRKEYKKLKKFFPNVIFAKNIEDLDYIIMIDNIEYTVALDAWLIKTNKGKITTLAEKVFMKKIVEQENLLTENKFFLIEEEYGEED